MSTFDKLNGRQPVTRLYLCAGVPVNKSYNDVIYFASASAKQSFYAGLANVSLTNMGEIVGNKLRIPAGNDTAFSCNYLMYQNAFHGTRWFYAFVDDVRRLSDNAIEITFSLDAWSTWCNDITIRSCFVEREHIVTDTFGANREPEGIDCSDQKVYDWIYAGLTGAKTYCVAYTYTDPEDSEQITASFISGIFSGCNVAKFDSPYSCANFLSQFAKKDMVDGVVAVWQIPAEIANAPTLNPAKKTTTMAANLSSLDGYTPRNKKLFQYPFNFLRTVSPAGSSIDFHYELFSSFPCSFVTEGEGSPTGSQTTYPTNYDGGSTELCVGFNSGALCAWSSSAWAEWCASQGIGTGLALLGSAGALVGGAATANIPAVIGGVAGLANTTNSIYNATRQPDKFHGSISGNLTAAAGDSTKIQRVGLSAQRARAIDDYFDRYGYATNRLKVPNISSRPAWNYVKTAGATVTGISNFDALQDIQNMLNRGVTFWKNGNQVGNYSQSNI